MKSYSRLSRIETHALVEFLRRNQEDGRLLFSHGELVKKAKEELNLSINRNHVLSFAAEMGLKAKNPRPTGTYSATKEVPKEIEDRLELLEEQVQQLLERERAA